MAGQEILKIYNNPAADFFVERKGDNSPLTIADKAAHKIIMQHLEKTGIPVLSEKGKTIPYETRATWKIFWLVDPLDGTKEFIKRNGEFTVNIALVQNGKPVMGVIYVPVKKTLYTGDAEMGAWKMKDAAQPVTVETLQKKGEKLPCTTHPEKYVVAGSRSHMNPETEAYYNALKTKYPNMEIISKGSSLKICLVAEGSAHEYPRFGPTMEWDTAAGHAIAKATGKNIWIVKPGGTDANNGSYPNDPDADFYSPPKTGGKNTGQSFAGSNSPLGVRGTNAAGEKLWLTDFSGELSYNKRNLLNPWFIVKGQENEKK